MSNTLELSEKYQPLFELLQGRHPEVDTVIITGGRYSLASSTLISAEPSTTLVEWVQFRPYFVPKETVSPYIAPIPSLYTPYIIGEAYFIYPGGFLVKLPKNSALLALY